MDITLLSELWLVPLLIMVGYAFGQRAEKKHYKSIIKREHAYRSVLLVQSKRLPESVEVNDSRLLIGSVVISVDYFKKFVSGLRALVGGRLSSYESLIDRGRREAILRMKAQALNIQSNMILNVKIETSSISKGVKGSVRSIEVIAYGTAVRKL